jgi:hypothetical protein
VLDEIAVTSLIAAQAHPARLADWLRRHRGAGIRAIEVLDQRHLLRASGRG